MPELISVGEAIVDFLPGPEPGTYLQKAGGAPANVAVAAARNGRTVGFCGRVGDDGFGRFLLRTLRDNGVVPLCPAPVGEATTTMSFVSLDDHGDRSFTFARKPGADMFLTRADVDAAGLEGAVCVHAGSCSLSKGSAAHATAYALTRARALGKLVSFDVNSRAPMWDGAREEAARAVQALLPAIDLLKLSEDEVPLVGGEDALGGLPPAVVVETLGGDGARCFWNGQVWDVPARPASQVVDTTGAGDAFWGGFLACLLRAGVTRPEGLSRDLLDRALDYGSLAGSLCVSQKGAMESLPTAAQIQAALDGRD